MSSLPTVPGVDANLLQKLRNEHSIEQQLWLSGYLYGLATSKQEVAAPETTQLPGQKVLILFGSHTGNSKKVAHTAAKHLHEAGLQTTVADVAEYAVKNLKSETHLLVVVSTQGEGEPPASAEDFYQWLLGPRAPKFENLQFSVCALGDKSYVQFCQTGKDIDNRLEALGAKRLFDRVDCDAEYETEAKSWINQVAAVLQAQHPKTTSAYVKAPETSTVSTSKYDRKHPFEAMVWEKIQLNGRGSEKETWHLEFSLEGSDLEYAPGDSLGVFAQNDTALVDEVLKSTRLNGSEKVDWDGKSLQLFDLLEQKLELSVLTRDLLVKYQERHPKSSVNVLIEDPSALKNYLWGNDVADFFTDFPANLEPQQLTELLRPLPPRLYSIASSPRASEGEVHLTVAAVRYEHKGRKRRGVASTYLADRLEKGGSVPVFVEHNDFFKLPANDATDIIMVGPGTGVAPFRAFVAERAERGASGKNWLFFGNPHFSTDFLYQTEWLQHLKNGALDRLDVAFSRDQEHKIYVQDRLKERSKPIYERLENGAYFYVCGDKNRMAADVQKALLGIVATESGRGETYAADYLKTLKKQRRFLEDVY